MSDKLQAPHVLTEEKHHLRQENGWASEPHNRSIPDEDKTS